MDLELKALSLTLALGVLSIFVLWLTVTLACGKPFMASAWHTIWTAVRGNLPSSSLLGLPAIAAFAVSLSLGIVLEDLSKNALAGRHPTIFDLPIKLILPTEIASRLSSLFLPLDTNRQGYNKLRLPLDFGCENWARDWKDKASPGLTGWKLSPQGHEIQNMLEAAPFGRLTEVESEAKATFLKICGNSPVCMWPPKSIACQDLHGLYSLYYMTNNYVYQTVSRADEMEQIQHRIDFVRSIIYLATLSTIGIATAMIWRIVPPLSLSKRWYLYPGPVVTALFVALLLLVMFIFSPVLFNVTLIVVTALLSLYAWLVCANAGVNVINVGEFSISRFGLLYAVVILVVILIAKSIYISEITNYSERAFGYYATYRSMEFHHAAKSE